MRYCSSMSLISFTLYVSNLDLDLDYRLYGELISFVSTLLQKPGYEQLSINNLIVVSEYRLSHKTANNFFEFAFHTCIILCSCTNAKLSSG